MRAREFITEAISLSTLRHELIPTFTELMNNPITANIDREVDLFNYIKSNVIEPLSDTISEIVGGNIKLTLGNQDDKVLGQSTYDTIKLSPKHVTKFIPGMIRRLSTTKNPTLMDIGEAFYDHFIHKTMTSITHEAVHMKQHMPQSTGNTEYRSSLFKNQSDFLQAVRNVGTDRETPQDKKIYMSSVQEIPAYAHNIVLDIIDHNTDFLSDDPADIQDSIEVLKDILQSIGSGDDFGSKKLSYYNKTFNHPGQPEHKIYKKLMKLVYQELTNYLTHWTNK